MKDNKEKAKNSVKTSGQIKDLEGFTLINRSEPQVANSQNKTLIGSDIHPTNVEGHYPPFVLPGALNLLGEDYRELSIILENFLPQLDKIGIELKEINNLIREIIMSTEMFRRLKGISQIELLPFAFKQVPWFTRFTHSCLTYVLADHIIDKLNNQLKLNEIELEAAKLAFLIHDLGHGPFSHLTERAFRKAKGKKENIPPEYDHEFWTKILLNELREILFDTYENPYISGNSITSRASLKKSKEYNLEIFSKALLILTKNYSFMISQLLSSQVDIDRLSNYIGDRLIVTKVLEEDNVQDEKMVKYLSSYNDVINNVKRIINNFVVVNSDLSGKKCNEYIAIHEDAVQPIIHFFIDRHIIRYYLLKHYRREAANNILEKILLRAQELVRKKDLDSLGKTDLLIITWLYGNHTEAEFIELDDQLVFNQIRKWAKHTNDPVLKDLTLRFTAHKFFSTYSCEKDGKAEKPSQEIISKLKQKVVDSLNLKDIPKDLIAEYYFTYDETTSVPYHTERDEVIIYTSDKKVKKLSDYIIETDNELGKMLLDSTFARYLFIVPDEIEL